MEFRRRGPGISGSTLKLIALFSMATDHFVLIIIGNILIRHGITSTADHSLSYIRELISQGSVGYYYLVYLVLRGTVGRIAVPVFLFLLVEGFQKTSSRLKYAGRLFLFAVGSEFVYDWVIRKKIYDPERQNILFTLLIGFLMMWGMEQVSTLIRNQYASVLLRGFVFVAAAFVAWRFQCEYQGWGIAVIGLMYLFRQSRGMQLFASSMFMLTRPEYLIGLIPIFFYNGRKGLSLKFFFYLFYPLHLLVLKILSEI